MHSRTSNVECDNDRLIILFLSCSLSNGHSCTRTGRYLGKGFCQHLPGSFPLLAWVLYCRSGTYRKHLTKPLTNVVTRTSYIPTSTHLILMISVLEHGVFEG